MAAPEIDKSKAKANLNTLVSKEKTSKPTQKHVLCSEMQPWPRASEIVEKRILSELTETLKDKPNIFRSKKTHGGDKTEKDRIRSQLQIGTSSVLRALERDELQCVLLSGRATPAVTLEHVISLGKAKGCPLLCLDGLSGALSAALQTKTFPLSIGFRKLPKGQLSDFLNVISIVKNHAHTAKSFTTEPPFVQKMPFHVNDSDEAEILAEIKRVFSAAVKEATVSNESEEKKEDTEEKPFDKYLLPQFEAEKWRDMGVMSDNFQLLFFDPMLERGFPTLTDQFMNMTPKLLPVIILPDLCKTLRVVTSGRWGELLLGIKKRNLLPPDSRQDFEKLIEICHKALKSVEKLQPSDEKSSKEISEKESDATGKDHDKEKDKNEKENEEESDEKRSKKCFTSTPEIREKESGAIGTDLDKEKDKIEKEEEEDEEEEEEEDYSYLYTLKKDSKDLSELRAELRSDLDKTKKATMFSSDFISFSAPTTDTTLKHPKTNSGQKNKETFTPDSKVTTQKRVTQSTPVTEKTAPQGMSSEDQTSMHFISFSAGEKPPKTEAKQAEENLDRAPLDAGGNDGDQSKTVNPTHSAKTSEAGLSTSQADSSSLFLLDRRGDGSVKKGPQTPSTSHTKGKSTSNPGGPGSLEKDSTLGTEHLKPSKGKEGLDVLSIDVGARSKHTSKALKRKLDQEQGFISFKYTEANIKTMVSNPSKKRKKKKK